MGVSPLPSVCPRLQITVTRRVVRGHRAFSMRRSLLYRREHRGFRTLHDSTKISQLDGGRLLLYSPSPAPRDRRAIRTETAAMGSMACPSHVLSTNTERNENTSEVRNAPPDPSAPPRRGTGRSPASSSRWDRCPGWAMTHLTHTAVCRGLPGRSHLSFASGK